MAKEKATGLFTTSRIVFYILAIFVFYLAIHYVNKLEDIRALLLKMNPLWLLLAIASQIATYLLNAFIVYVLLGKKTGAPDFFTLFKMSLVIIFINQALPTGGLSGNGYVLNQLLRRKIEPSRVFRMLILASVCYYIAMIILLVVCYSWYINSGMSVNPLITSVVFGGVIFFTFLGAVMLVISNGNTLLFVMNKLSRFNRLKRYIEKADLFSLLGKQSISHQVLLSKKKESILAVLFQLGIIGFDMFTAFAIMKGFHVHLSFTHVALGVLLSMAIGALPISPGSLIAFESAMTYFLTTLGAPIHAALIVTLLFRFLTFWLPMPIGLLLYRNLQKYK